MKYSIKCDDCKKTIGTTNSMGVSAQGGRCRSCRNSSIIKSEKFLAQNIIGGGFRRSRKGLINLNSTDDLARM
jgi:hypothetical protein